MESAEANKGALMVDPLGAWWIGIYLGYAIVFGGVYALYALGTPVWQIAVLALLVLLVTLAGSSF